MAFYLRVSTGPQAERDLSIPDQRRQMKMRCDMEGWKVVGEFKDACSAKSDRRPGFQELFQVIEGGGKPFDIVMVHSLSRFFRNAVELELRYQQLRKLGIRLISISEETDDTPTGRMVRGMFALNDEILSYKISRDVSRSLRENARQGFWCGSTPPYGYCLEDAERRGARVKRRLAVDPVESELVRQVYRLYLSGNGSSGPMGVKAIVNWLNENGHRTRKGSLWGVGAVHRLLTDPVYKGEYRYNRNGSVEEVVEVDVPSTIDAATFDRAQRSLRQKNPRKTAPRTSNGPTLLGGIAKCGKCGSAMTKRTGKSGRYRYYACSARNRTGEQACEGQSVPMEDLDDLVTDHVSRRLLNEARAEALLRELVRRQAASDVTKMHALEAHRKRFDDAEAGLRRLYTAIQHGIIDPDDPTLREQIQTAKAERDAARANVLAMERSLAPENRLGAQATGQFTTLLRNALVRGPISFRRAYLRAVLERVEVHDEFLRIHARADTTKINNEPRLAAAA
ncbi:recombinase family protein [Rhodovulum sp. 12E13]|uniref:recombinase family protein n=1 Tax=Rhodovulum sp. 12E13 TaxID=2203891 RepID=UPI001314A459|nr:recombinase family protein [Rhodovulum sp. 12E13]